MIGGPPTWEPVWSILDDDELVTCREKLCEFYASHPEKPRHGTEDVSSKLIPPVDREYIIYAHFFVSVGTSSMCQVPTTAELLEIVNLMEWYCQTMPKGKNPFPRSSTLKNG